MRHAPAAQLRERAQQAITNAPRRRAVSRRGSSMPHSRVEACSLTMRQQPACAQLNRPRRARTPVSAGNCPRKLAAHAGQEGSRVWRPAHHAPRTLQRPPSASDVDTHARCPDAPAEQSCHHRPPSSTPRRIASKKRHSRAGCRRCEAGEGVCVCTNAQGCPPQPKRVSRWCAVRGCAPPGHSSSSYSSSAPASPGRWYDAP